MTALADNTKNYANLLAARLASLLISCVDLVLLLRQPSISCGLFENNVSSIARPSRSSDTDTLSNDYLVPERAQ